MRGLAGKRVLVTGGGGGIGGALCKRFAEEDCVVVVFDVNMDAAQQIVTQIHDGANKVFAYHVDISDYDAVCKAVQRAESEAGAIDVLVNNAGWDKFVNFLDTDPLLWEKLIAINLKGPLNMHHVVLKKMTERNRGKVVNIASDAGRVGSSLEAVYSACKGGIIAFTKTMARELARSGICLNVVCPGPTDTPLLRGFFGEGEAGQKVYEGLKRAIPLKRLGQPEDIPGMVAFLASDDANFITGQVISVSGGLTMHG